MKLSKQLTTQPRPASAPGIRNIVKIPMLERRYTGDFISFNGLSDEKEHIAIGLGDWRNQRTPLVRIHSECLTGDVFGSRKCDCGNQLNEAVHKIARVGGILIYLRQEGRGIGLYNKLDAYELQSKGYDTYEANRLLDFPDDLRSYQCAAQMLHAMSISSIRLLSNNPVKAKDLRTHGIDVVSLDSTGVFVNKDNYYYLHAKRVKTAHNISFEDYSHDRTSRTD